MFLQGKGFSVSVGSVGQMMKMGVSADFSICKGKRKDGMACTMATNKYVVLLPAR
jgi:minichromosome maintenance protein 10